MYCMECFIHCVFDGCMRLKVNKFVIENVVKFCNVRTRT